jgi:hypothetical protein
MQRHKERISKTRASNWSLDCTYSHMILISKYFIIINYDFITEVNRFFNCLVSKRIQN